MQASLDVVEQLVSRVAALEQRLAALERAAHLHWDDPVAAKERTAKLDERAESAPAPGGVFSVAGSALLGIAGAYLLRALAAGTILPRGLVASAATVYALAWLIVGARARRAFAAVLFTATSILILAPMLWEMFLRFHAMPGVICVLALALYAGAATALASHPQHAPALVTAYLGASITGVALSIATHEAAWFAALLVAMVAVSELAKLRGLTLAVRAIVALAADFAVWMLLYIYRSPASTRTDYPALGGAVIIAIGCALLPISAAAIGVQALKLRRSLGTFDIAQSIIALLLAGIAIAWFSPAGALVLGGVCLLLSAACYIVAFGPLRGGESRRNFRVFATWSAGLLLASMLLSMPTQSASVALAVAAVLAMAVGVHFRSRVLRLHAEVFLLMAVALSGWAGYVFGCLTGDMPGRPGWAAWAAVGAVLGACVAGRERPGELWPDQVMHLVPMALAAFSAAAMVAGALVAAAASVFSPGPGPIALARTIALCATALVMAFAGTRWRRASMTRISYAALALVCAKLLFEDLRHGRLEFIAASIFLVAVTLIAVPRLAQRQRRASSRGGSGARI